MMDDTIPLFPAGLPGYLYFATEAEALAAEAAIAAEIGCDIVGVNAATGQLDPAAQKTVRWAIPMQAESGQWVIPAPPKKEEPEDGEDPSLAT